MKAESIAVLEKIGILLGASSSALNYAKSVLLEAREKHVLSGRNPMCLAAAALYIGFFLLGL
jgi:transcription initiation factor TFIIIB Brf1 subunit/transcription initiation factor TFIIB